MHINTDTETHAQYTLEDTHVHTRAGTHVIHPQYTHTHASRDLAVKGTLSPTAGSESPLPGGCVTLGTYLSAGPQLVPTVRWADNGAYLTGY